MMRKKVGGIWSIHWTSNLDDGDFEIRKLYQD